MKRVSLMFISTLVFVSWMAIYANAQFDDCPSPDPYLLSYPILALPFSTSMGFTDSQVWSLRWQGS